MVLRIEIREATDLHTEALATVHLTETLERPTEMARHTEVRATAEHRTEALETVEHRTEVRATADLHTEAQAETLHIEAQEAAMVHTEVREAHHTEALEVHLTEALVAALHTEAQEVDLHTEAQEAAADEALAEAHEAEEAEDKPNAFKITILYKQTKHYNHEKVNCNSVFAHCGSCVGIGTKRV